jgi:CheY-like chemotaxis protein
MQPPQKPCGRAAFDSDATGKSILLVEDDPDMALLLVEFLEGYFYRVTRVVNGVDGLKAVLGADFDVILCDMVMPQMPGDLFYFAVQRMRPELCERFIFMTAHGENPRTQEFLNRVSEMVLAKPFHLDDVLEAILLLFRELEGGNRLLAPGDDRVSADRPSAEPHPRLPV